MVTNCPKCTGLTACICQRYDLMFNPPQQGWTCPKCGRVYGPAHHECVPCNDHIAKFGLGGGAIATA